MTDTNNVLPVTFDETNPLINPPDLPHGVPALDRLKNEHLLPAIRYGIAKAQQEIAAIRNNPEPATFENTIEALKFGGEDFEYAGEDFTRIYQVFDNICSSNNNDAIRAFEETISAEKARHLNDVFLNAGLFSRIQAVYNQKDQLSLTGEQRMLLKKTYEAFVRKGATLPDEQKIRFRAIDEQLAVLGTRFKNNTVKAKESYRKIITDEAELDGVPERAKNIYRNQAKKAGLAEGAFLITFAPYPSDILTHCTNRSLRAEISNAYGSLCYHDAFDNTDIIINIVRLRHERAQMLGYATHADYVLSDRMAESVERVNSFLEKNLAVYKPVAEAELQEVRDLALKTDDISDLKIHDMAYYSRLLEEQKFDFKSETLRPFFKLENVIDGMHRHAEKLFNIDIREEKTGKYPVYHEDVKTYEVYDKASGAQIGILYGDYFVRNGSKRGGAWCGSFRDRGVSNGIDQIPLAINCCNFSKPTPDQPTLLALNEVESNFHEFGHALHVLLAEGKYPSLTGANVKWDFVELFSMLQENWAREPSVLAEFAHHYQTGEVLPAELHQKMKAQQNFQIGTMGLGQTFLALLDMAYHSVDANTITSAESVENPVVARTRLLKRETGLMSSLFLHLFDGGYDAGYYCYKWAEGMEADIYSEFQKRGLYDPEFSSKVRKGLYARGGTDEPMNLYIGVMSREPDTDALFRREGLLPNVPDIPSGALPKTPNVVPV